MSSRSPLDRSLRRASSRIFPLILFVVGGCAADLARPDSSAGGSPLAPASGGAPTSGGVSATGGASEEGSMTGGLAANGGLIASGGLTVGGGGSGSASASGGAPAAGGGADSGGAASDGGAESSAGGGTSDGGAVGAGGAVPATYATIQQLILTSLNRNTACGSTTCHGGRYPPTLVWRDSRDDMTLYQALTTTPSKLCGDALLVVPFDPTGSALVKILKDECENIAGTSSRMPFYCDADPLYGNCITPEQITAIEQWIADGAQL